MKMLCGLVFALILTTAGVGQARQFSDTQVQRLISEMRQVDFEVFGIYSSSCGEVYDFPLGPLIIPLIDNPLTIDDIVIETPHCLRAWPCEPPWCEPDPDHPIGRNVVLRISPGATITFLNIPVMVVLDLQPTGRPFTLRVTDSRGRTSDLRREPELFGKMLLPLFSPHGVHSVQLVAIETQEDDGPPELHIASIYLP